MEKRIIGQEDLRGKEENSYESLEAAFLNNISHEIRTPLNAIVGFATLLTESMDHPEHRKEYLNIILRSSDHLLEIIDEIVEISKIEAGTVKITREKVNILSVMGRVYDQFLREAAQKAITLSVNYELDFDESRTVTDSFKLTQILKNLVSNALKFTFKGKVEFGCLMKEGMIEFYISDTGKGISSEHHDHLFKRFYQVDSGSSRCYGGLGLGLAISKAYVQLLGGDIWFTSKPDEGSVFRFTIPTEKKCTGGNIITNESNCDE